MASFALGQINKSPRMAYTKKSDNNTKASSRNNNQLKQGYKSRNTNTTLTPRGETMKHNLT